MLQFEIFKYPEDLCDWINENESLITILSVCNNEFSEFVLFYTSGNANKLPDIEEDFANNFRNC